MYKIFSFFFFFSFYFFIFSSLYSLIHIYTFSLNKDVLLVLWLLLLLFFSLHHLLLFRLLPLAIRNRKWWRKKKKTKFLVFFSVSLSTTAKQVYTSSSLLIRLPYWIKWSVFYIVSIVFTVDVYSTMRKVICFKIGYKCSAEYTYQKWLSSILCLKSIYLIFLLLFFSSLIIIIFFFFYALCSC